MTDDEIVHFAVSVAAALRDLAAACGLGDEDRAAADLLAGAVDTASHDAYREGTTFLRACAALLRHVAARSDAEAFVAQALNLATTIDPSEALGAGVAALLTGSFAVATLRRAMPARQDATTARETIASLALRHSEAIGDVLGLVALDAFTALTGAVVAELSRVAADRAPLVRVEVGLSMPSTLLAWALYQDPERAGELVARNRVGTPLLMPSAFEAIAP